MATFVQPTNPEAVAESRVAGNKEVTLYFINYLLVHPQGATIERQIGVDKAGEPILKTFKVGGLPKNNHPIILSSNDVIQLPPLGGQLTVRRVVVEDLKQRTEVFHPKRGRFEGFTESKTMADAVRVAFDAGKMDSNDFESVETFEALLLGVNHTLALEGMTVEELEKELQRRQAIEGETEASKLSDSKPDKKLTSTHKN